MRIFFYANGAYQLTYFTPRATVKDALSKYMLSYYGKAVNMSSSRKSRLIVPEAYDAMTKFKMECAQAVGAEQFTKEKNDHYKGDLTSKQNGTKGGPIGGEMVKRMIKQYEESIK
jgi:small acid-soluble spore protein D (minor alpha/beta-type SASP)